MTAVRTDDHPGGVRVLTMDRPPANAINDELLVELDAALAEAKYDDAVRAVVLTGEGRFFSAGFDLKAERRDGDAVTSAAERYKAANRRLFGFPKPTVAAINGHCVAGGFVLAMACDHRLAADAGSTIGVNEVAIGAAWPIAAMEIMRARLPDRLLAELMLGARLYPAAEAVRLGLADRIVPPAELESDALELAADVGRHPAEVYANTKARLIGAALARIDGATLEDDLAISTLWSTDSSRAARRAHVEGNL
ncbi:MAG: enoyl-CoA hydratase [Actinomycetota bacterium]|jgi:enoyl-CoA hydratase